MPAPALAATPSSESIPVPFADILARLGGELAPLPTASVSGFFPLPVATALAQLPTGAVRVRFAEIRQAAPAGSFKPDAALADTLVELPLAKVLGAINPKLLARRPDQKKVEDPADIPGIFGLKDQGRPAAKPAIVPPPTPSLETIAAEVAPPPPAAPAVDCLTVKLSAVYEMWPETIREEITRSTLNDSSAAIPMDRLESAMKTGRVVFPWGDVRPWLDGGKLTAASTLRDTLVEFPLKVVTPLFMGRRKTGFVQTKVAVPENIPNLFAVPTAAPAPPTEPAPVPAPAPEAVKPMVAAPVAPPAPKEQSPQEITSEINALPGVAGSIIAMNDGLLVAGSLPPPIKSETMAAFLPQLFGRLTNYAGEIQLGQIHGLTLHAGQAHCAIFKTGTTYLAVLSKAGEPLPEAPLQRIASALAKRSQ